MKRTGLAHIDNGVAAALDVVGEWWTPLVVHCVLLGETRFDAIQSRLGIARNILTDRLNTLVDAGVLERVPYSVRPARNEYRLTEMGHDLHPVLEALEAWGNRWMRPGDSR
ncbi:MAG: winged helix-turn-helix transcriptional regulator [Acidimicrobiales bacterium]